MDKIELNIIALSNSESQPGNFVIILEEFNGIRRLPIIIGQFEAQAIAMALEQMRPQRPQTHDLLQTLIESTGSKIKEIQIFQTEQTTFGANLTLELPDKSTSQIDSRSSDALALAVRFKCPIYTSSEVLATAGIHLSNPSESFSNKRGQLTDYSIEELEAMLQQLLAKEDYKSAARIRDAIQKKRDTPE